jgi:hypothetical protein
MDRVRHRTGILAGATVVLTLLASVAPIGAFGAGGDHTATRVIAPGVTLTTITDIRTPQRTFVLTVDPAQGASLDAVLSGGALARVRRTSDDVTAAGALAGINGDFTDLQTDLPVHPVVDQGQLVQTSRNLGASFVIGDNGSADFGTPAVSISATQADTGETWVVDRWNHGGPHLGEIAAYTDAGGDAQRPSNEDCVARLVPAGPSQNQGVEVIRDYAVASSGCGGGPTPPDGGVVLAAQPSSDEATTLRSLSAGETVTLDWSVGFPSVKDLLGGGPMLVDGGRVVLGACSGSICAPNPRTAVGVTADGRFLLVVADGRQSGYSIGMTLNQLAVLMISLGAVRALNLDGGGSTTMVVKGAVVNRPSDGGERTVSTALLVLPASA